MRKESHVPNLVGFVVGVGEPRKVAAISVYQVFGRLPADREIVGLDSQASGWLVAKAGGNAWKIRRTRRLRVEGGHWKVFYDAMAKP